MFSNQTIENVLNSTFIEILCILNKFNPKINKHKKTYNSIQIFMDQKYNLLVIFSLLHIIFFFNMMHKQYSKGNLFLIFFESIFKLCSVNNEVLNHNPN